MKSRAEQAPSVPGSDRKTTSSPVSGTMLANFCGQFGGAGREAGESRGQEAASSRFRLISGVKASISRSCTGNAPVARAPRSARSVFSSSGRKNRAILHGAERRRIRAKISDAKLALPAVWNHASEPIHRLALERQAERRPSIARDCDSPRAATRALDFAGPVDLRQCAAASRAEFPFCT